MKSIRANLFLPVLAATALWPAANTADSLTAHSARSQNAASSQNQKQTQSDRQAEVKTFAGTVTFSNGKYVLEDPSAKRSYYLDDEKAAKKFEGKMVVVTGTLDSASYTIRVQKIEAAT
jgi:NAD-dependent DNA ligase